MAGVRVRKDRYDHALSMKDNPGDSRKDGKPATFTGSGLFHFWMRDIVLASIHFRDRRNQ